MSELRGRFLEPLTQGRRWSGVRLTLAVLIAAGAIAVTYTAAVASNASSVPDKARVQAAYASLAALPVPPAPKGLGAAPSLVPLPVDQVSGISPFAETPAGAGVLVASTLGPPGAPDVVFANDWYENTANDIVEVYAGRLVATPDQGVVIVAIWDTSHADWLSGGRYLTPAGIGPVTIVGATGEILELRGTGGSAITFDPRTGTFR